ncbi:hypothetical protein A2533_03830 [Candidatus Falkowbacteria bacterium RIFOXYD2_FULL_35_9]|uniref:Uncharacterized protein n=1 Tax=Candidatus Falkowbacteria bacterium RIFOXYC2_FULL_36_12 TaxID=1798002 RepID=A0A1F5SVX0_9BACT|nr:MAG: hypothetical protein A2300_00645 [Candidatus Falkowbacteria bacterium RIFOXYB2_FULL_35_7]OGF30850.1 MAG: hypothetical protein A2478_00140 [Candidatus Falkowbacteria bacterium RIFOXYC2_FULL_36_12]OGF33932.1 MAG: hypothetical protein A2223_04495 [Candidatus Falkowbacteria bacterium RIFOXYA2_FULL_35_8]OGF45980.1 MAG: hypothetical protein A2533_03830 [Candidatus Falkowbacteria bacterium RIFOXYD2_FULL_35_9]
MSNKDDYILVKDKDGNLKYYKDGQYFDIDEIDAGKKPANKVEKTDKQNIPNRVLSERDVVVNKAVEAVVSELKISFTEEEMKRRFFSVVGSRFREVRGDKEVKYMLMTDKTDGGMGLDERKADVVLAVIKKHASKFTDGNRNVLPQNNEKLVEKKQNVAVRKIEVKKEEKKVPEMKKEELLAIHKSFIPNKKVIVAKPVEIKPTTVVKPVEEKPVVKPVENKGKEMLDRLIAGEKANVSAQNLILSHGQNSQQSQKQEIGLKKEAIPSLQPLIQPAQIKEKEVKYKPQLVGPLEELRQMTLEDFRRLGRDANEMMEEVKEKIAVLQEDSWKKGVDGLKAWRESEVHKLYTEMGLQSILTNKSLDQIIVDRQVKNQPVLTLSEFDEVLGFNKNFEI